MRDMTNLEEEYFKLRYKNRMESTKRYLGEAEKITDETKKSKFLKDKRATTLINHSIKKDFKKEMNSISDDELKDIIYYFKDYHTLYSQYYSALRTDLFLDPVKLLDWFNQNKDKCDYCGISAQELKEITIIRGNILFEAGIFKEVKNNLTLNGKTKRSKGTLEIERTNSQKNTYKFSNVILACPLCNNAKSNLIDEEGWRKIFATPMREYYKSILGKELLNANPNQI